MLDEGGTIHLSNSKLSEMSTKNKITLPSRIYYDFVGNLQLGDVGSIPKFRLGQKRQCMTKLSKTKAWFSLGDSAHLMGRNVSFQELALQDNWK